MYIFQLHHFSMHNYHYWQLPPQYARSKWVFLTPLKLNKINYEWLHTKNNRRGTIIIGLNKLPFYLVRDTVAIWIMSHDFHYVIFIFVISSTKFQLTAVCNKIIYCGRLKFCAYMAHGIFQSKQADLAKIKFQDCTDPRDMWNTSFCRLEWLWELYINFVAKVQITG